MPGVAASCGHGPMDFLGHGHIPGVLLFRLDALVQGGIALSVGFFQVLGVPDLPGDAPGRPLHRHFAGGEGGGVGLGDDGRSHGGGPWRRGRTATGCPSPEGSDLR